MLHGSSACAAIAPDAIRPPWAPAEQSTFTLSTGGSAWKRSNASATKDVAGERSSTPKRHKLVERRSPEPPQHFPRLSPPPPPAAAPAAPAAARLPSPAGAPLCRPGPRCGSWRRGGCRRRTGRPQRKSSSGGWPARGATRWAGQACPAATCPSPTTRASAGSTQSSWCCLPAMESLTCCSTVRRRRSRHHRRRRRLLAAALHPPPLITFPPSLLRADHSKYGTHVAAAVSSQPANSSLVPEWGPALGKATPATRVAPGSLILFGCKSPFRLRLEVGSAAASVSHKVQHLWGAPRRG